MNMGIDTKYKFGYMNMNIGTKIKDKILRIFKDNATGHSPSVYMTRMDFAELENLPGAAFVQVHFYKLTSTNTHTKYKHALKASQLTK